VCATWNLLQVWHQILGFSDFAAGLPSDPNSLNLQVYQKPIKNHTIGEHKYEVISHFV
jgi:hypothetical protein